MLASRCKGATGGRGVAVGLGLMRANRNVPSLPPTILAPHLALDVNTAPPQVLTALPHVGRALASRLVEARNERPFASLEDIGDRVRGVGPVTLARLAPYLRFESSSAFPTKPIAGNHGVPIALNPKASRRKTARTKRPVAAAIAPQLTAMGTSSQSH